MDGFVTLKLKDGREFQNPLWCYRPEEGWLSLVDDGTFYFREMESCIEHGVRINPRGDVRDIDLLTKAREHGWDGE